MDETGSSLTDVVDRLIKIYARHPEGLFPNSLERKTVREIGQTLYETGGLNLMLAVHQEFAARDFIHARNLELIWDGIGEWMGKHQKA